MWCAHMPMNCISSSIPHKYSVPVSPKLPWLIKNGIWFYFRDFGFNWFVEPHTYFMLVQSIHYIKAKELHEIVICLGGLICSLLSCVIVNNACYFSYWLMLLQSRHGTWWGLYDISFWGPRSFSKSCSVFMLISLFFFLYKVLSIIVLFRWWKEYMAECLVFLHGEAAW